MSTKQESGALAPQAGAGTLRHGEIGLLGVLMPGLAQVAPGETVAWLLLAVVTVYIFLAMKRFYRQGWMTTTLKFVSISGIYTFFFLLPAMAGILALSFFGGSIG